MVSQCNSTQLTLHCQRILVFNRFFPVYKGYFYNISPILLSEINSSVILFFTIFKIKNLQSRNFLHPHVPYGYELFLSYQRCWACLFQKVQKNFSSSVAYFLGVRWKNHYWKYMQSCKCKCWNLISRQLNTAKNYLGLICLLKRQKKLKKHFWKCKTLWYFIK